MTPRPKVREGQWPDCHQGCELGHLARQLNARERELSDLPLHWPAWRPLKPRHVRAGQISRDMLVPHDDRLARVPRDHRRVGRSGKATTGPQLLDEP